MRGIRGGGLDLRKRKRKTIWGNGIGYMHGRLQELSIYLSSIPTSHFPATKSPPLQRPFLSSPSPCRFSPAIVSDPAWEIWA